MTQKHVFSTWVSLVYQWFTESAAAAASWFTTLDLSAVMIEVIRLRLAFKGHDITQGRAYHVMTQKSHKIYGK